MLYAKGVFLNRCFDELNLTQPDLVADLHQAYVRAGADVIETNTFGANRVKLASFGLESRLAAINEQGARLARAAARDEAYVAGAIGPLGIRVEPFGKTGLDEAEAIFREQAEALAGGGVDLFMLETFRDLSELGAAVRACRAAAPHAPDRRAADHGRRRPHARRHAARAVHARARIARRRRDRPELQRRPGRHARNAGAHGRGRAAREALRAAQRRTSARRRRPQHLSVVAGIHGVVRAPLHRFGREAGGRVLRHDAGTRASHQARGARARAGRARGEERVGDGKRAPRPAPLRSSRRSMASSRSRACTSRASPTRSRAGSSSSPSISRRRAATAARR